MWTAVGTRALSGVGRPGRDGNFGLTDTGPGGEPTDTDLLVAMLMSDKVTLGLSKPGLETYRAPPGYNLAAPHRASDGPRDIDGDGNLSPGEMKLWLAEQEQEQLAWLMLMMASAAVDRLRANGTQSITAERLMASARREFDTGNAGRAMALANAALSEAGRQLEKVRRIERQQEERIEQSREEKRLQEKIEKKRRTEDANQKLIGWAADVRQLIVEIQGLQDQIERILEEASRKAA